MMFYENMMMKYHVIIISVSYIRSASAASDMKWKLLKKAT